MKRRIHSGRHRPGDVLLTIRLLPENVVGSDDRGGETGNAGLDTKGLEVFGKQLEDKALRRRRRAQAEQGHRQKEHETAHKVWLNRGKLPVIVRDLGEKPLSPIFTLGMPRNPCVIFILQKEIS